MSNWTEYRWPDFRCDRISLEQLDISSSLSLFLSFPLSPFLNLFLSYSLSFFLPIDPRMFQFAKNETKFNPGRKQVCARALKTPTSYRKHLFRNFLFQFVALQLSLFNLSMYHCRCSMVALQFDSLDSQNDTTSSKMLKLLEVLWLFTKM